MSHLEDPQGIYTEILEENRILKEKLKKKEFEVEIESLTSLGYEELEKGLKISGILLAEGVHNGVYYSPDEIKKMVEQYKDLMIGMDLTVEHERTDKYDARSVGKHLNVLWNPTLKAALYEAIVTDPDAIEDIKKGTFGATSMRLREKKVTVGDFTKAVDLRPINNTLTQFPACSNCNVFHVENLSLNYLGVKELGDENVTEIVPVILEESELKKLKCPVCGKTFDTFEEFLKHWNKEHKDKYGTYGEKSEMELDEEELVEKGETKIAYNKKTKKYILMVGTGKKKLAWKIVGQYDSKEEAKKAAENLSEILSTYTDFISKCMKEGKSMKECAKEWKTEKKTEEMKKKYPYPGYEGEVKCPACGKVFKTYEDFIKHWNEEHKDKYGEYGKYYGKYGTTEKSEEVCPVCGKSFKTFKEFIAHWNKEHKEQYGKYGEVGKELAEKKEIKCPACGKVFKTYEDFLKHWNEEHKEKYGTYGKYKEMTEKQELGEEELRRTRCPYCGQLYADLNKHFQHCEERKKTLALLYKCKYCDKTFNTEEELINHLAHCSQFKLSHATLSEEKKEEEKKEETGKKEEKKETEEKGTEEKTKEEKVETKKEKEEEEKIVKEEPKKLTPEEILEKIKESKGDILDKATELLLKREEKRW